MARVLVVDDERSLRRTFALFLRADGHTVDTAEDVDEAVAALELAVYDVIVSDIILPRRSGVSLLELVAERWPATKVVLVTGEPTVETAASAVRSGAYDYVAKPVSSATIRRIVSAAAGVKALEDDNRRLQRENDRQRQALARLVEVRTAEVRDTRQALASTEARVSRIAANIPGVLLQFERSPSGAFAFTFLAPRAAEAVGVDPAAVLEDPEVFLSRVHADDRPALAGSLDASARAMSVWSWEGRLVADDGEVRWFQAQSIPVQTPDGTIVWDGVMLDTTERKDLQARLMLADRMASIGTLAAGVAHEINNPLTYVLANLHVLERWAERALADGPEREQARAKLCSAATLELLRETADGARRVREIARDLKTFSRSAGEVQAVDVHQVLDSSLRMAIHELRHRARLVRDYAATPLTVANPARLGQVFLNLIINAAQAIPPGDVERNEICLSTRTGDDGWAEVRVRDTGTGVPPELVGAIFEPFVTMKPVGIGTGLGLYICRDIILHAGGSIAVESTSAEGTTFVVRLPPAEDAANDDDRPTEPRPGQPPLRANILVIDDEANIGRSFARSLPEHDITSVDSGRDGIAALDRNRYDLVFCDVMMPDVTGRGIYEHVVQHHPDMVERLVFMTGGAFTKQAREFVDTVAAHQIDKPFDVDAIRDVIQDLL